MATDGQEGPHLGQHRVLDFLCGVPAAVCCSGLQVDRQQHRRRGHRIRDVPVQPRILTRWRTTGRLPPTTQTTTTASTTAGRAGARTTTPSSFRANRVLKTATTPLTRCTTP